MGSIMIVKSRREKNPCFEGRRMGKGFRDELLSLFLTFWLGFIGLLVVGLGLWLLDKVFGLKRMFGF